MNSILIRSEEAVKKLLAWRDQNKDLVRQAPVPTIGGVALKNGVIIYKQGVEVNFIRNGNVVHIDFRAADQNVSFDYNFDTWEMSNVVYYAHAIPYPKEEALQDILTVYASTMAFMVHCTDKVLQDGTEFGLLL